MMCQCGPFLNERCVKFAFQKSVNLDIDNINIINLCQTVGAEVVVSNLPKLSAK